MHENDSETNHAYSADALRGLPSSIRIRQNMTPTYSKEQNIGYQNVYRQNKHLETNTPLNNHMCGGVVVLVYYIIE